MLPMQPPRDAGCRLRLQSRGEALRFKTALICPSYCAHNSSMLPLVLLIALQVAPGKPAEVVNPLLADCSGARCRRRSQNHLKPLNTASKFADRRRGFTKNTSGQAQKTKGRTLLAVQAIVRRTQVLDDSSHSQAPFSSPPSGSHPLFSRTMASIPVCS
jgi:hypothetical protein